jgi:hypothetical protein
LGVPIVLESNQSLSAFQDRTEDRLTSVCTLVSLQEGTCGMDCQLHIRISNQLRDAVIEIARAEDVSPSVIARRAVKRLVEEYRQSKAGGLDSLADPTRRPRAR